jgi:hypothetical protein
VKIEIRTAGASGALALGGLWAAGTCVLPDVDHSTSLAAGLAVAGAILAAVDSPPVGTAAAGRV